MFEDIMSKIILGVVILIGGLIAFGIADEEMGTQNIYSEKATVTDTYKRHVKSGNATITKYYIKIQTETGEEAISVTHDFYDKVEVDNEIDVTKTVIETRFTHDTVIKYDID